MNLKDKLIALKEKQYLNIRYNDVLGYYSFNTEYPQIKDLIKKEINNDKYYYDETEDIIIDITKFAQRLKDMMKGNTRIWISEILENINHKKYGIEMILKYDKDLHTILKENFNIDNNGSKTNICFIDMKAVEDKELKKQQKNKEVDDFIQQLNNNDVRSNDDKITNDIVIGVIIQNANKNIYIL